MFAWSAVGKRMLFGRRDVFTRLVGAVATATASIGTPNIAHGHSRRVSQADLDDAIERHAMWLVDGVRGARAIFSHCDLSGLDFGFECETPVDLREADFTAADLTEMNGNVVGFVRAAMRGARLSSSQLKRPVFSYASLSGAKCNEVVWGWDEREHQENARLEPLSGAVFLHTDAGHADFKRATIRAHFEETRFGSATLVEADLSHSHFCGPSFAGTSFFRADLTRTKFRRACLRAVRFRGAICDGTDFADAEVGADVKLLLQA
jgi:uncharacterized protein YjbI with pentapeptide repeats